MLIAASIYSWQLFSKFRMFKRINQSTLEFEEKFGDLNLLRLYNNLPSEMDDPMAMVFKTNADSLKSRSKSNLSERLTNIMATNIEKQMSVIEKNFTFLATVGATAPFIGLFGTFGVL